MRNHWKPLRHFCQSGRLPFNYVLVWLIIPLVGFFALSTTLRVAGVDESHQDAGKIVDASCLPGTRPLTGPDALSERMMEGLHRYVERKTGESIQTRQKFWRRDFSSRKAYEKSIAPNRKRFMTNIGVVDSRLPTVMQRFGDDSDPALVAETEGYSIWQVRWTVLDAVFGEGLLLRPKAKPVAHVVALPDADQTPEQIAGLVEGVPPESQFARRLAENGFQVVVPVLISRSIDFSGNPRVAMTNQPHREWIYRQAFHMGRHVIGYEVQKVLAAVDWFKQRWDNDAKIGVVGYGEGGLIAFYAAAVDTRIDAALVSGYFDSRQRVWAEPIYRNVWSLLHEFGDAEVATLIAPRGLVVEYSAGPKVDDPPPPSKGRLGGAALGGKLGTPPLASVAAEFKRIDSLLQPGFQLRHLVHDKADVLTTFGSQPAMQKFGALLGAEATMVLSGPMPTDQRKAFDFTERQRRQVRELENHAQSLLHYADQTRNEFFLNNTSLMRGLESRWDRTHKDRIQNRSAEAFAEEARRYRQYFWEEVLGKLDDAPLPLSPRSRKIYDREKWAGYEVVLDVYPEVFSWGILLVPKDLKAGEKRPVVVCQHGRDGLPKEVIEGNTFYYRDFAARLADRGFIVFAPHNLYRGEDLYRNLNRKTNPLKASIFSLIIVQHQQILNWLQSLPYVDPKRIAFYGLSYGGETALRVPPILEQYCLSICSGIYCSARKVASTDSEYSFMFTEEWEMPYFNMGSTFSHAEMAYLMAPRPFMIERGHHDGVTLDEWVEYEYAKVRWLYSLLGQADKTEIEFFNGGHTINGQGTFDFLHKHLNWPKR